jgi:hypothetical protein
MSELEYNNISSKIIKAAIEVHKEFGPGLLESVKAILSIYEFQLLTYLKLSDMKLGLLINFNVLQLKDGIKRKINGTL